MEKNDKKDERTIIKEYGENKRQMFIWKNFMKLERTYEVRLNFKKEAEKKEKKICSTVDLQTCVIKINVMCLLHYSLYRLCNPTLY